MAATPEGLITRTQTTGPAVDITYASHSGTIAISCTGCPWGEQVYTGALTTDPPEKEEALIERHLPEARNYAQTHAASHH